MALQNAAIIKVLDCREGEEKFRLKNALVFQTNSLLIYWSSSKFTSKKTATSSSSLTVSRKPYILSTCLPACPHSQWCGFVEVLANGLCLTGSTEWWPLHSSPWWWDWERIWCAGICLGLTRVASANDGTERTQKYNLYCLMAAAENLRVLGCSKTCYEWLTSSFNLQQNGVGEEGALKNKNLNHTMNL